MPYRADAVANELLKLANVAKVPVSPMKAQKLVYFGHGWYLALQNEPLIREEIQAWKYGPVIQTLYREFKEFGKQPITRLAREVRLKSRSEASSSTGSRVFSRLELYEPSLDDQSSSSSDSSFAKALVQRIWELYGQYSAAQLSRMTHAEGTPWHTVASEFDFDLPSGISIPDELIKGYFSERLNTTGSQLEKNDVG